MTNGTASEPQLDQVVTPEVSLGKRLTVHLAGLAETACDLTAVRLRLDGYTFGNQPELDDLQNWEIAFSLERLDADRASWTRILGAPPLGGTKEIAVSLELPDKSVLPHVGRTMPTVRFVIFTGWQLIGGLLLAAVLLLIVFVMAHHTGLLRDTDATITDPKQRTFSLGRCQMAFWFVLLTVGFVAIWVITWDYVGILTSQSLGTARHLRGDRTRRDQHRRKQTYTREAAAAHNVLERHPHRRQRPRAATAAGADLDAGAWRHLHLLNLPQLVAAGV